MIILNLKEIEEWTYNEYIKTQCIRAIMRVKKELEPVWKEE